MKTHALAIGIAVAAVVLAFALYMISGRLSAAPPANKSISLCIAGAYAAEAQYLGGLYANSTGARVAVRPGGSFALAHEIAVGVPCDVFMPVAFRQAVAGEGPYNPGWAIAVAADEVVIVYSDAALSAHPGASNLIALFREAGAENGSALWRRFFRELASGRYPLGIADPATDPESLYAFLMLEAAGELYAGNRSLYVGEVIANRANVTRSSTFYYVVPLKEGEIAFVFSYKSYAVANGLRYLEPPPWLNFGNASYSAWYSRFSWTIPINGVPTAVRGTPVYLYATIPADAPDEGAAVRFILFLLSHRDALARFGLYPLPRPLVFGNASAIPSDLRQMLQSGGLVYGGPLT